MQGKKRGLFIFLIVLLVLVLAGGGVLFALRFQPRPGKSAPAITIISPESPTTVAAGEFLYIQTSAQASEGITRVEMAADGAPYRYQEAEDGPALMMPVDFTWHSEQAGAHTLTFTAIGTQGDASLPATLEVIVAEPAAASDGGSALPDDVETWQGPEVIAAAEAIGAGAAAGDGGDAGQAPADEGDAEAGEAPPDAEQAADEDGLDEAANEDMIDAMMGIPVDKPPAVRLLDGSLREGGGLHILVDIIATDNSGVDTITATIAGNGNMETQFFACAGQWECRQRVDYQLNAGEVELVVHATDDAGQMSMTAMLQFQVAQGEEGQPPALVVDRDFDPNEIELVEEAAAEERRAQPDDFGAPRITAYACGGNSVRIGVPYRYHSNNGRMIYAGGFAGADGQLIAAGWVPVEQGTNGFIEFDMETTVFAEEGQMTGGMTLQMMTEIGAAPFYAEQADLEITWPLPKPDLVITDVQRSINGRDITVTVENRGCADVDGFTLATYLVPTARHREAAFTESVPQGGSSAVTMRDVNPNDYASAFTVIADPDDVIDEIDDRNNSFQKPPIRIKHIHFDRIEIHDTSDGEWYEDSDEGEFRLYVTVHEEQEIRPSRDTNWVWTMGKGFHEIKGVIAPIILTPNITDTVYPMTIVVDLEEEDTFSPNDWAKAVAYLTPDMNDVTSWRLGHGHDRALTSSNGRFTIHYWIVLDF